MPRTSRREFSALLLGTAAQAACHSSPASDSSMSATPVAPATTPALMPTVFVGHGSPMNALLDNQWSRGFAQIGQALPTPKAILCISAHWMTQGTAVTLNDPPRTIHDFGGFPPALHQLQYRAPGDADLGKTIAELLHPHQVKGRSDWGLDHGTWSVLCHSYPRAQIPVLQLSLDAGKSPAEHLAVGRSLAPLRQQGVLIIGSGNITHNLRHALTQGARQPEVIPAWASRFDADVANALQQHDFAGLAALPNTPDGKLAHPSQEHYLPLLYVAAAGALTATGSPTPPTYPITGFDMGSIAMRAVQFG